MKKQSVIYSIIGVSLAVFTVAAVSKIVTSAKSSPEAVADQTITPENVAEQKAALEAVDPADLQDGLTHDGVTLYHDEDSNIYRYDENGKLIGLTKLAAQDDASLPTLDDDALRDCAAEYLAGVVADPKRYTLEEFRNENGICTANWMARCCGYKTTDIVSIMMNPNGTLQGYMMNHTGDFADVTVTEEQIADAISRAEAEAASPDAVITRIDGTDQVVLTLDDSGTLMLQVGITVEITTGELQIPYADLYTVPVL